MAKTIRVARVIMRLKSQMKLIFQSIKIQDGMLFSLFMKAVVNMLSMACIIANTWFSVGFEYFCIMSLV